MTEIDLGTSMSHYFVTEEGDIYWQQQSRFQEMTVRVTKNGYRYIQVGTTRKLVHRLIATAFIPNPENKRCVNHKDGNKLNNGVKNLEWATHSENMRHAVDTGLWIRQGSKQNNAKLTESIVTTIRKRLADGEIGTKLAKEYGVAHGLIYDIKNRKAWRHV